jgi:thiamine pyrophosphokinase
MRLASIFGAIAITGFRALATETIAIPNGSFELPIATFPSPNMDSWQKTATPDWYDGSGGFDWTQLTGEFENTPPGAADHIDNCDGAQAAWMFVVPEVGIFQDYDFPASHAFNAVYEPGKSYRLTAGIIGTGGQMLVGSTIEVALYYRDAASNMVVVAATSVTNLSTVFSNNTHFIDFHVDSGFVRNADPWAGQHIGVRLLSSIADTNLEGGYWDLDNVRLTAIHAPTLSNPAWTNGQLFFFIQSETGMVFEIQKATDFENVPVWSSIGNVTNDSGTISFTDTNATSGRGFYRAQLVQ